MIDPQKLKEKFIEIYGGESRLFRAPGRVNLIGEHTDYNGGFVLPMAIDKEAAVAIGERSDRKIRVYTVNLGEAAEFDLDEEKPRKKGFWLNYIEGVARILESKNVRLKGADLIIWSDVPTGAGLSSSAALEMATGLALSEISGQTIDRASLAKIGQQTEHDYVGAKVGIMDQFVSAHARARHALLLDCRSLEFENVPLDTGEVAVVMCDTNVKHDLATSGYNRRREECEQAVRIFKENLPDVRELRDVSREDFEKYAGKLPELIRRRARHVITENERTLQAANALKRKDLIEFGRLMWQSHESLKNDYEVSCRELDVLVEIAGATDGVLGARMTGGGFGGSTVNLVKRENLADFREKIQAEYERLTGIKPTILVSDASAGASEMTFNELSYTTKDS
ncbi:MAG TPA: galactokinase [Pyrinomonadaceae bacterium]|jgi:galactokinase